jgi:hypothetical protein
MKIEKIWFDAENIFVQTDSQHIIGNPLEWFPRLQKASLEQLNNYQLGINKESIHWQALNEDLSLESFFDFKRELIYAKI